MHPYLPDEVLREICAFARARALEQVILFGSRAKGTHTERSDVDLAVSGGDTDGFYWDLKDAAHTLLTFDVVALDDMLSDDLKKEIDRDGVMLYEKTR
ncbi:MAG: nucleotidyltransferase domain-containing protein [Peptococcaceae bacterium]|nr:nucleotidyltransferase domain-containing protein [Peptococcaceae bacterium]